MATNFLFQSDLDAYGHELVDFSQRSALHAISPHIENLVQQQEELRQRLAREARRNLDAAVERAIPNYREIDRDPHWHRYLLSVDAFTGRVRQGLLNEAIASSDPNRVIAFFKAFQREAGSAPASSSRSRSAALSGKPFYSREQIAHLYSARRKGEFASKEAEWNRIEADIFAAQREGRVQGTYLTK